MVSVKLIRFLISACIVLLTGYISYTVFIPSERISASKDFKSDQNTYFNISDFTSTEYIDNAAESVLSAESAVIKARKFSIFKINQLNELVLKKAVLNINMNNKNIYDIDPFENLLSIMDKNLSSNKSKFLNIEIDDLEINLYQKDVLLIKLRTQKATVKFKGNNTKLKNLILEQPATNRRIASKSATWNAEAKYFFIDGPYLLETPRGNTSGKNIKVNFDFDIRPQN